MTVENALLSAFYFGCNKRKFSFKRLIKFILSLESDYYWLLVERPAIGYRAGEGPRANGSQSTDESQNAIVVFFVAFF